MNHTSHSGRSGLSKNGNQGTIQEKRQAANSSVTYGNTFQAGSNNESNGGISQTTGSQYSPSTLSAPLQQPWQYTCLNNVKILHNVVDARAYVQNLANVLEINTHQGNEEFIENLLGKIDGTAHSSNGPIEYLFNGDHEKCYILVLIQKKGEAVAVGYSYHSVIDVVPNNNTSETIYMPNPNVWEWFKRRAYQSLKLPASLAVGMAKNRRQLNNFQNRQLSLDQSQQQMVKVSGDNTRRSSDDDSIEYDLFCGLF